MNQAPLSPAAIQEARNALAEIWEARERDWKIRNRNGCVDCTEDVVAGREMYMVTHALWRASGLPHNGGYLCIGCLEARVGRTLRGSDFTDVPLNDPAHSSPRMSSRLVAT